jgi:amino acid transporter
MADNTPSLRRSLRVVDGMVIAASSTAATTSIAVGMGVLAAAVGTQTPIILVLAFLPVLGIAAAYARLNRVEPNCGNGYVWVGKSLGPWLGFLTGWLVLVGTLVFLAYTTAISGSVIVQLADTAGLPLDPDSTLLATAIGLVVLALVAVVAITGVAKAAWVQKWLLAFEYAVLIGFSVWGIAVGGIPFSWSWLNPFAIGSFASLAQGLVLAVFFFWGWDAAFSVTEETRGVEDAGRGGFIALFTMLGLFVLGAIAFQRVLGPDELVANGAQGLGYYGAKIATQPFAVLLLLALMFSAIGSLQAGVIPNVRQALAMGRDRTLGRAWTLISARYGTPAIGTVLTAAIAAAISLLSLSIPTVSQLILAAVNAIGVVVSLYYGMTAIACAVRFRGIVRSQPSQAVRAVFLPALCGTVLLTVGGYLVYLYLSTTDHFEVRPDNGWFELLTPALIVLSGLGVAAWAKWRRRSPYFRVDRVVETEVVPGGTAHVAQG